MDKVKVSVILPVYNVEEFLGECLESLVNQTLTDIEIICVNDGPTDNSLEILKDYAKKDSRIIIIDQDNHNAGHARNQGLKIAKGEYLSFLDADDFFKKTMLEKAYNHAKSSESDVCIFKAYLYDNMTGNIKVNSWSVKEKFLPSKTVFNAGDVESNIFKNIMCWAWDKLFKRSLIAENNLEFQEQRTTNDMYFVFSSLLKADKITILSEELYYQRRNVSSSLSNSRELSWDCFYNALTRLKGELVEMDIYSQFEQDFVNYALQTCLWNLNTLEEPMARQLFEKLKSEWFGNLGICHQEKEFFDNKYDFIQYLMIDSIPLDNMEAYTIYQASCRQKTDAFKQNMGKVYVELTEPEILTVQEVFDRLTLI